MFDAWKEKLRKEKEIRHQKWEARCLAEIQARDARLGNPTLLTLRDRLGKAAISGLWGVVDDCIAKGSSVNETVRITAGQRAGHYFDPFYKIAAGTLDDFNAPLLCMAAMHGDVKAVENLLAQGADPSCGFNDDGRLWTPLRIAVKRGDALLLQVLCDKGADLSNPGPLHLAEKLGRDDMIRIIRAEETKRAQAAGVPLPPVTPVDKIISDIEKLPPVARGRLLVKARQKFFRGRPGDVKLAHDVAVLKPINLKKRRP